MGNLRRLSITKDNGDAWSLNFLISIEEEEGSLRSKGYGGHTYKQGAVPRMRLYRDPCYWNKDKATQSCSEQSSVSGGLYTDGRVSFPALYRVLFVLKFWFSLVWGPHPVVFRSYSWL